MKMPCNLVHHAWLLSVVATSLLLAGTAFGQATICPGGDGDFDGDGFSDALECDGFSMLDPLQVEVIGADGSVVPSPFLPSCFGQENPERQYCASAEQSDLFVIVVAANPSGMPSGPLETATRPISEGGLGMNVHLLIEDPANPGNRRVAAALGQKALRITESLDPNGEILGQSNYGTPNGLDRATIWTTRIANFVAATCSSDDDSCRTNTGALGYTQVTDALARWVVEHEMGHSYRLSADYNKRFGGYHLKAGTDSVMAQFISYSTSKKTGVTTLFIPQTFDAQSQADALLAIP
jgi:hypothetical protein